MGDEPGTGATPAAGATPAPSQSTGEAPKAPAQPATGEPEDLGDAGKAALREERQARAAEKRRADDLEAELTKLRDASSSEQERAIAAAKREAAAEERAKWQERFRAAEVRGALRGAGIANDRMLALAMHAPEFASLQVGDDGTVSGVAEAVEQFRAVMPEAFQPKGSGQPAGQPRTGVQPPPPGPEVKPGYERLTAAYAANEQKR